MTKSPHSASTVLGTGEQWREDKHTSTWTQPLPLCPAHYVLWWTLSAAQLQGMVAGLGQLGLTCSARTHGRCAPGACGFLPYGLLQCCGEPSQPMQTWQRVRGCVKMSPSFKKLGYGERHADIKMVCVKEDVYPHRSLETGAMASHGAT